MPAGVLLHPHLHAGGGHRMGDAVALNLMAAELEQRRAAMIAKGDKAWVPAHPRKRHVSKALQAYALMATSAATGAVRDLSMLKRR